MSDARVAHISRRNEVTGPLADNTAQQDAAWIASAIRQFCDSPHNSLQDATQERAWGAPLIGFSSGADPLYEQYKDYVGPYHWTPAEIFAHTFPDIPVQPGDLTVIAWILPQTQATKQDNRQQTRYPAERWARSRIFGEEFNKQLRRQVVHVLGDRGFPAVAPFLSPHWERKDSQPYVISSTWSERHAAYASGLGTFGLCDGLITPTGKAVRVGSVVARVQVPHTERPYQGRGDYCLFLSRGTCGECIDRCPVGALSEGGHDKNRCREHLDRTREYVKATYGFEGYGCGLCQTGVRCESEIPVES